MSIILHKFHVVFETKELKGIGSLRCDESGEVIPCDVGM